MKTYISILRGINVSGHNLIKMDSLRKLYENLGYQNVTTYLQSGNVVFSAKDAGKNPEQKISSQIEKDFGFKVPVIILTTVELKQIIAGNPFMKDKGKDPAYFYVTFLSEKPAAFDTKTIEDKKLIGEDISFSDDAVYLYCPNGYGNTKLSNNFLESRLKVTATTRNWKTVNELLKTALLQIKK